MAKSKSKSEYPATRYSAKFPGGVKVKSPADLESEKLKDGGPWFNNPALKVEVPAPVEDDVAAVRIAALTAENADLKAKINGLEAMLVADDSEQEASGKAKRK